ncbi:hypothetical protein HanXRQr2_Chr02g0050291 [Helianthus annuus]|uniref:Uncharacterized protein n=1 Tax=Helianthus annuus TaxID=4232 RepID=A0A9K3JKC1_HELAN|nr:hypothetical protein HanXRQr2_Chr02g0050291 [Helianthus annuus]KAJ0613872.1 hypothetical protein HanIR_Chr02g0056171 [Helianthus annuus]
MHFRPDTMTQTGLTFDSRSDWSVWSGSENTAFSSSSPSRRNSLPIYPHASLSIILRERNKHSGA